MKGSGLGIVCGSIPDGAWRNWGKSRNLAGTLRFMTDIWPRDRHQKCHTLDCKARRCQSDQLTTLRRRQTNRTARTANWTARSQIQNKRLRFEKTELYSCGLFIYNVLYSETSHGYALVQIDAFNQMYRVGRGKDQLTTPPPFTTYRVNTLALHQAANLWQTRFICSVVVTTPKHDLNAICFPLYKYT